MLARSIREEVPAVGEDLRVCTQTPGLNAPEMAGPVVLTPSAETAEDLKRANEELRRANQGLEEFAYVASHDLREPLRMVNIYTQLLIQRFGSVLDEEGRQFAQHVHYNVARMEELIEDVLSYSSTINPDRTSAISPTSLKRALGAGHADLPGQNGGVRSIP